MLIVWVIPPLVLKGLNGGMLSSSTHIAQLLYQVGESAMTVSWLENWWVKSQLERSIVFSVERFSVRVLKSQSWRLGNRQFPS